MTGNTQSDVGPRTIRQSRRSQFVGDYYNASDSDGDEDGDTSLETLRSKYVTTSFQTAATFMESSSAIAELSRRNRGKKQSIENLTLPSKVVVPDSCRVLMADSNLHPTLKLKVRENCVNLIEKAWLQNLAAKNVLGGSDSEHDDVPAEIERHTYMQAPKPVIYQSRVRQIICDMKRATMLKQSFSVDRFLPHSTATA